MSELRKVILQKHQAGKTNKQICQELSEFHVSRWMVYRTLRRFRETGKLSDRKRTGRPRSVRTRQKIKVVKERVRRNPARSIRKMAKDLNISECTMRRILHEDLGLRAFKKRKVHGLTETQKKKRYERSGSCLARK